MKQTNKQTFSEVIALTLILIIIASGGALLYQVSHQSAMSEGYLSEKRIPSIVEGTAKMVETERYFKKHTLETASVKVDLRCNNSHNLELKIGYKGLSYDLHDASEPTKEVTLWSRKNLLEQAPKQKPEAFNKPIISKKRLNLQWNLLETGFTKRDYVKADERIWYLKITDLSAGPYGYERNETRIINGTTYNLLEYYPTINHLNDFKLSFNKLVFETLFYPFFDGSKEVIIPIRGVNHELAIEDPKTNAEINGMAINSYTTTIPGSGSSNLWAIVFGTSNYLWQSGCDDLLYPPIECRSFILGCERSSSPTPFEKGIMDYGWRVAYSMDGDSDQTDIATCTQTDDNYLEDMFDFVDGELGLTGKLIVFVANHGIKYYGSHLSITGKSRCWLAGWTDVIRLNEYENKIEAITEDGTHVLLWVSACHGDGLDSFSSSDHHYSLESWSFRPYHVGSPSNGYSPTGKYTDFCWCYSTSGSTVNAKSECAFFFLGAAEGTCAKTVTEIGEDAQSFYNNKYDSTMYIQSTWSSAYSFYVNWGY
jgi:hypothetical protein